MWYFLCKTQKPRIVEENNGQERQEIFSERVRAGKRTYFFDVKATRSNDYYLTITESKRRYKEDGFTYEKHKIFLYKEDFDKFVNALNSTVNHVKEELMPEIDFSQFERSKHEKKEVEPQTEEVEPVAEEVEPVAEEVEPVAKEVEPVAKEVQHQTEEAESGIDSELKWE